MRKTNLFLLPFIHSIDAKAGSERDQLAQARSRICCLVRECARYEEILPLCTVWDCDICWFGFGNKLNWYITIHGESIYNIICLGKIYEVFGGGVEPIPPTDKEVQD